ncbi:hypothetical protein GQ457_07G030680 [Hibiscus cannabinus]
MERRVGVIRRWWSGRNRMVWEQKQDHGLRFFTQKGSNRAAVHGEEELEQDIKKGKEVKESRRKEVEKKINSQVKTHQDCNK